MSIPVIFMLAVGLSMDAFSLSLIYGTLELSKKRCRQMSIIVGIFHFIMPILGYQIGEFKIYQNKPRYFSRNYLYNIRVRNDTISEKRR